MLHARGFASPTSHLPHRESAACGHALEGSAIVARSSSLWLAARTAAPADTLMFSRDPGVPATDLLSSPPHDIESSHQLQVTVAATTPAAPSR